MISAEVPFLFAKACELFITELTHKAWNYTEYNKRRTLQRIDITGCIQDCDIFDFLIDLIPKDEFKATTFNKSRKMNALPSMMGSYMPTPEMTQFQQMQFPQFNHMMGMPHMNPTEYREFAEREFQNGKENTNISHLIANPENNYGEVKEGIREIYLEYRGRRDPEDNN